jgi:Zn-dependent peptidase ImmA (M78 family)
LSRPLSIPEKLLQDLGIERPQDIDLEAIAWELGARVKYRELRSYEARIVGRGDRAIITVDEKALPRRKRFSIAHELGHWHHHRGRCLICRSDEIGDSRRSVTDPERVADDYASDLILPRFILDPISRGIARPTLKAVREVADMFDVSLTATLLKIVEADHFPIIAICHSRTGRRWFRRAPSVPERWFPQQELDHESFAFTALFGQEPGAQGPRKIPAEAWFDRSEARQYDISEETFQVAQDQICTVLFLNDRKMLRD